MLNTQDHFDKHLLRLGSELRDLWRRRYIRVPLDEPIQRGWRRFHVLTAKAENRADKDVLIALLKIIGTVQFRNSPDFRNRRGRGRRRRFVEIEQPLHELTAGRVHHRGRQSQARRGRSAVESERGRGSDPDHHVGFWALREIQLSVI